MVSPLGDVLVAEDGTAMRLAVVFNNLPPKLLMQITRGNSEITGPAFTPDGKRLYFSSQRGPSGSAGTGAAGVIYEMTIPDRFVTLQRASDFFFEEILDAAPSSLVTSDMVTIDGFNGPLWLSISSQNGAQFKIDDGAWTNVATWVYAGDAITVRHTASSVIGEATETTVSVGLPNGATRTDAVFLTLTAAADAVPDPFDFGTKTGVPAATLIESDTLTLTGFNVPVPVVPGPSTEYRIHAGQWTNQRGTLEPRQTLQVRHVSITSCHGPLRTFVKVGGVRGYFTTLASSKH